MDPLSPEFLNGLIGGGAGGGSIILAYLIARAKIEARHEAEIKNLGTMVQANDKIAGEAKKELRSRINGVSLNYQARILSLERRVATIEGAMQVRVSSDTPVPAALHAEDENE